MNEINVKQTEKQLQSLGVPIGPKPPEVGPKVWKPEQPVLKPEELEDELAINRVDEHTGKATGSGPLNWLKKAFGIQE